MKIALVSGANKGIGFEIVKELAEKGIKVILTARDILKGKNAIEKLIQSGIKDVEFHQLDVTDEKSIEIMAKYIEEKHGKLDILINNAGISIDGNKTTLNVSMDTVRKTLEVNFYGPFKLSQALIPFLLKSEDARIINISSGMGSLSNEYTVMSGFPSYCISKTALNGLTVKMATDLKGKIKVNSVSPGWVKTDLGGKFAPRSVEEGADTTVWLATAQDTPTGKFIYDREIIDW